MLLLDMSKERYQQRCYKAAADRTASPREPTDDHLLWGEVLFLGGRKIREADDRIFGRRESQFSYWSRKSAYYTR
jgi:hypothetical protein